MAKPTTDKQLETIALVPFRGILMRSEAAAARFACPCAFVINLTDPPGTNWIAVFAPAGGAARWIDLFGLPPPTDLLQHLRRLYEDICRQPLASMSCGQRAVLALVRAAYLAAVVR